MPTLQTAGLAWPTTVPSAGRAGRRSEAPGRLRWAKASPSGSSVLGVRWRGGRPVEGSLGPGCWLPLGSVRQEGPDASPRHSPSRWPCVDFSPRGLGAPPTGPSLSPALPRRLAGRCADPLLSGAGSVGRTPGGRAGATGSPRPGSLTAWLPPPGTAFARKQKEREGAPRGVPHSDPQRRSPLLSGALCPHVQATRGTSPAPRLHEACVWGVGLWDAGASLFFSGSFSLRKPSSLSSEDR